MGLKSGVDIIIWNQKTLKKPIPVGRTPSPDLEDSIPPAEKGGQKLVKDAITGWRGGSEVVVRVNEPDLICEDIDAAIYPGLNGIHFPGLNPRSRSIA
jgi:hypothetical protein